MFIDKKEWDQGQNNPENDHKWSLIFFGIFSVALIVIIVTVFFLVRGFSEGEKEGGGDRKATSTPEEATSTSSGLPGEGEDPGRGKEQLPSTTTLEAEKLQYGDFYDKPDYSITATSAVTFELPLNVKTDVSNYYDINRKIVLEEEVDHINKNGFTVISNPYSSDGADNFYSVYKKLDQEGVPLLITKDFLQYYYQNTIKNNFKKIESNIFYENLWDINSSLYKAAKLRYKKLLNSRGVSSDPYLQAARMEVAYFGVALKLLEPQEDQISQSQLTSETKFSPEDKKDFSIDLPEYLQDDIPEEIELIRNSKKKSARSPTLFYERNYRKFRVPKEYQNNARLTNFYLASKWLNSVFPLYYKSDACPECKLDKADWRINMLATCLIAEDFSRNQEIKNDWAQIYKVISYFRGLRDEFTYLDYVDPINNILEEDKGLKDTFLDKDLEEVDEKLTSLRNGLISDFHFSKLEGAHDHTATSGKPVVGLRVLSQPYTPDEYIFKQLTYPQVGEYTGPRNPYPDTICQRDNSKVRCKSMTQDVTHLVYPTPEVDEDFARNTDYKRYDEQVNKLRDRLNDFGDYTWRSSNYWTVVNTIDSSLENEVKDIPVFNTQKWRERNIDFFLGSLVKSKIGADKLKIEQKDSGFGSSESVKKESHYIEPNLALVREMKSNIAMLMEMLSELHISDRVSSVEINLEKTQQKLNKIENVIEKQLKGEELTSKEIKFIQDFVTRYEVTEGRRRGLEYERALKENIDGVELLFLVYKKGGKKVLGVGPVFDYERK